MEAAIGDRAITPAAICLGIAGVDREDEARTVRAIMRRIGYKSRVLVVNDALIGLVAGARDEPGIAINAGTGSIVYGRNADFEAARAGGWGHMIGDEGSGYWIGRESLAAVMRAADGRGPETRLTAEILAHFNVDDESRLPRIVYDRELPRVERRRARTDRAAGRRTGRRGRAAAFWSAPPTSSCSAARSVATRLEMRGDAFTFYLAGGVFRVVPWLAEELPRAARRGRAARPGRKCCSTEPAVGAVWLALAEARGGARVPRYKTPPLR